MKDVNPESILTAIYNKLADLPIPINNGVTESDLASMVDCVDHISEIIDLDVNGDVYELRLVKID